MARRSIAESSTATRTPSLAPPPLTPTPTRASETRVLPIQRQTLTSMTLDALRERILHGTYPEGEPLRQDALAEELGVSRIPVREALRQLEAEGLVTFNPHRGAVVSTLSLGEIEELFELRAEIELDLFRRALPHIGADDLARAKEILDTYETSLRNGDVGSWGTMNWQFHSTLYAPSERQFTLGIARRKSPCSISARSSKSSSISLSDSVLTTAPRCGLNVTSPSASSCRSASRTGIRLTPSSSAIASCRSGSPSG